MDLPELQGWFIVDSLHVSGLRSWTTDGLSNSRGDQPLCLHTVYWKWENLNMNCFYLMPFCHFHPGLCFFICSWTWATLSMWYLLFVCRVVAPLKRMMVSQYPHICNSIRLWRTERGDVCTHRQAEKRGNLISVWEGKTCSKCFYMLCFFK